MTNKQRREWPIIVSVATRENLSPEDRVILLAMRDAEAGSAGNEFGARDVANTDIYTQATSAARSIKNNRLRYDQYRREGAWKGSRRTVTLKENEKPMDFIEFMAYYGGPTGYGYAPIHAPELREGEKSLNKNWAPNVRQISEKHQKYFKAKGVAE